MSNPLFESAIEEAALAWLESINYTVASGPDIAPEGVATERDGYEQVVLEDRLRNALFGLNSEMPHDALEDAFRKLSQLDSPSLVMNNYTIHRYLVEGVPVEYQRKDGSLAGADVQVIDFENPDNNDFLVVNQFTVVENKIERRPDIVIFVNGLPLAVIELKNPADEKATIWTAYNQLQTYKEQIPSLFAYNAVLLVSDGLEARVGTLTASREWFMPWRTIDGDSLDDDQLSKLQVVLEGVFDKRRFLELIKYFIVFEDIGGGNLLKKMAGYHQFHAVRHAIRETVRASGADGDKRIGVVWHTQGSGKSLTMAFFTGRAVLHRDLENPTIVLLTDRNDLDDQLFGTFSRCRDLLRQQPVQAQSRGHLRDLLKTAAGGVIFTTVQKFFPTDSERAHPLLSERKNIILIADEAHRSQYDFIDGFARHMRDALPNASFIGFTGTPIEKEDANTRAVFGDYISIYDIEQAVQDGSTVPIYYESRLAMLDLDEAQRPSIDDEFEEVTESEEFDSREKLKAKWSTLESLVGTENRLQTIAADLVAHFEKRQETLFGKAMIVCMSRRICVDLYNTICRLRPNWHSDEDSKGKIKIIMTGSASDPVDWQNHIRNKSRREELGKRFKDPSDHFQIAIVRDMWLTGFDVPCLHTMYVDKPMLGHGLMQAIARVNRVYKDKPGGLIVDYIGLADQLKKALSNYTESGGKGSTAIDQNEAVALMLAKHEVCCDMFHGFNMDAWLSGDAQERLSMLPRAQEHILSQEDGKNRFVKAVVELTKAYALSVPHEEALKISDDVAFFQTVKAALIKSQADQQIKRDEIEYVIRQIISKAVVTEDVIDVYSAAGIKEPDISILSDEFLADVRGMEHKNLAVELLKKLLDDKIRIHARKNLVIARSFTELLENAIAKYHNRAIETIQVIEELIQIAKDLQKQSERGEKLGLSEDEVAFYDALGVNDSAVAVLGDEQLRIIAQEIAKSVKSNVKIDWAIRENVRAQMRVIVKRILRKYGYPPDKQARATELVLEQAELICRETE
ncbi:MAG: type I restriction endonuclease subunit R [Candidatus Cloacimonadaceae bacterium]|jgi:type I restriction enzyme R subunit|nr:type I restriction endonuclease subunit R [Candidatus Cloacimonadota bacterium]MDX9949861.1 type I restriction endonuclease subunit R [Candidatus Syntrophosphaera sp.]